MAMGRTAELPPAFYVRSASSLMHKRRRNGRFGQSRDFHKSMDSVHLGIKPYYSASFDIIYTVQYVLEYCPDLAKRGQ
jgi:hypothetical protein